MQIIEIRRGSKQDYKDYERIPSVGVKLESRKTRRSGSVEWPLDRFTSKPEESV